MKTRPRRWSWILLVLFLGVVAVQAGCGGAGGASDELFSPAFGTVVPLTAGEVQTIISRAVASIANPDLAVVVVDRTARVLGAFSNAGPGIRDQDNIALSLARTTAFFSNSQAPLSSRTVQFLSTFHFPPTFDVPFLASVCPNSGIGPCPNTVIAPQQTTTGIAGTAQGPLWQINSTNRGAFIANPPGGAIEPAVYNAGKEFARSLNLDGTFPSPGITLLPGAVPLFKLNAEGTMMRLVGGVGCFVRANGAPPPDPNVLAAEFAAISGARGSGAPGDENFFLAAPNEGAIYLGGILLPYVQQTTIPAGFLPGVPPPPPPGGGWLVNPVAGIQDPFDFLIGPRDSVNPPAGPNPGDGLTSAEVTQIINQCVLQANGTRAAIRLPLGSSAKIIAVVTDLRGRILAHFRMEDTLTDAVDVVPAKARTTVYYSRPGGPQPADQWPGFPLLPGGVAVTTRTLGFVSQPFYPPGIDTSGVVGPIFPRAINNQFPAAAETLGAEPPDPGFQNGLIFFPGSVPLYKNGILVGALGVSGDGVEGNDFIAAGGAFGFEAPTNIRIDNFFFQGVRLPYLKFPQNPGPGGL